MSIDLKTIKQDFPILSRLINNQPLIYLDNAATSQKPESVIDAISSFYLSHNANVHRGVYTLSEEATDLYENARVKVASFIGAVVPKEVIFTKNATEGLNIAAFSWGMHNLRRGDEIVVVDSEHHSNLVPWQIVAKATGSTLVFVPAGDFEFTEAQFLADLKERISSRTKVLVMAHASNVLGTIFPVKSAAQLLKHVNPDAVVVVDGSQAAPHLPINVSSLQCDFYAFSAHKMLGPTGIGALWVTRDVIDSLEPYMYGGGMIDVVEKDSSTWQPAPERFEAGTPNIAGAVGFSAAIDYLKKVGMAEIQQHEQLLTSYALEKLSQFPGLTLLGPKGAQQRTGLVSFVLEGMHSHDVASVLSTTNVCVRSGHHCAMPLHKKLKLNSTVRASWYLYNTTHDIDMLVAGLERARTLLG